MEKQDHIIYIYPVLDSVTAQKDVIASLCLQQGGGSYVKV